MRLVPGLGTRAVDRLSDDYPVLLAPGQPGLRVNVTADEIVRYSPKRIDVINLETNTLRDGRCGGPVPRASGTTYPWRGAWSSLVDQDRVRKPVGMEPDWETDDFVVTFEGLITETPFVAQIQALLTLLREKLGTPVDIEFAHDGHDFYLLQCRRAELHREARARAHSPGPSARPHRVHGQPVHLQRPRSRHHPHRLRGSGGIRRPRRAGRPSSDVGRAVGRLNTLLPKRQFILMGPGRWGSRGDIKLGVNVTYSDINNTAMLMEIARQKGNYVPDLSFGTHFFQDLVEADIRYLPLYPDDPGIVFNEAFLRRARNMLPKILPEFSHLAEVVRVIDVPAETDGRVLQVLMNADLDEAVGVLAHRRRPGTAARRDDDLRGGARRRITGAGACAWPSASPPISTASASACRRCTCSAAPRTPPPDRPATST